MSTQSPHRSDPADLPLVEAAQHLRDGRLTCRALVESHLTRIAARDPGIGAFVHVDAAGARAAAARADHALASGHDNGPLHGIPFAVKDLIDVAGWPVRFGSRRFADRIAATTAPCVARLIGAGAIPLGLTATYELATVGPDPGSLYPQPRNPWSRAHVTGGSSSGSAAAVAAGMVRIALGTDTGGSIRSPAAWCGIVGLKPERGAVPMAGVQPLAPALDVAGPMAATVNEAALVMAALTGAPAPTGTDLDGRRIGYARAWAEDPAAHPALLPLLDEAAAALGLRGAGITLTDLPDYAPIEATAARILQAEQSQTHAALLAEDAPGLGAMALESLRWGHPLNPDEIAAARRQAQTITAELDAILAPLDALILPTTLTPAPPFAAFADGKATWSPMRTLPFNLTGHPALTVPMGFADGLPMGLQIVGPFGSTPTLLLIGAAFEAATDHTARRPYPA